MSAAGRAHAMSYFTKKEEDSSRAIFSNVTRAANPPFSNYSSLYSSFQLYTPPETMSSGTVHTADFCITTQRLLAATKIHGKWRNVIESP
jgi:hypothetical protein